MRTAATRFEMVNGGVKLKISKHGSGGKKQRYNEVKVTCAICGEVRFSGRCTHSGVSSKSAGMSHPEVPFLSCIGRGGAGNPLGRKITPPLWGLAVALPLCQRNCAGTSTGF